MAASEDVVARIDAMLDSEDGYIPDESAMTPAERELALLFADKERGDLFARYRLGRIMLERGRLERGMDTLAVLIPAAGAGGAEHGAPSSAVGRLLGLNAKLHVARAQASVDGHLQEGVEALQELARMDSAFYADPQPDHAGEVVSADAVVVQAQKILGDLAAEGRGLSRNIDQAVTWWKQAAKEGAPSGNVEAMARLGLHFGRERRRSEDDPLDIIKPDYSESFKWFLAAAELGHVDAAFRLGMQYRHGQGTKVDQRKALEWIKAAASTGNHLAAQGELTYQYYTMRLFNKAVASFEDIKDSADAEELTSEEQQALARAFFALWRCQTQKLGLTTQVPQSEAVVLLRKANELSRDIVKVLQRAAQAGELP